MLNNLRKDLFERTVCRRWLTSPRNTERETLSRSAFQHVGTAVHERLQQRNEHPRAGAQMFVPANEVGDGGESGKLGEPDRDDEPLGQDKTHRRQEGIRAITSCDHRRAQSDYVPIDSKRTRTLDLAQVLRHRVALGPSSESIRKAEHHVDRDQQAQVA
jgi:hypothetical protein